MLLIRRSPHVYPFPGLFNGVGGHVERGEDILSAAIREVEEEAGLCIESLQLRAILTVAHSQLSPDGQGDAREGEPGALVFVFVGHLPQGETMPKEAEELRWVALDQLHELEVVPDLHDLLPRVLEHCNAQPLFLKG